MDWPVDGRRGTVLPFSRRETNAGAGSLRQDRSAEVVLSCCRTILAGAADRLEGNLIALREVVRQLPDSEAKAAMEQQRRQIAVQLFMLRRMLAGF